MRILFLTPRFPLPAIKGDKLRAWHFIKSLSAVHEVVLVSFIAAPQERQGVIQLRTLCEVHPVHFRQARQCVGVAKAALRGHPLQVGLFHSDRVRRIIDQELPSCDAVHCNTLRMASNLPNNLDIPVVVDFIDALSRNYAEQAHTALPPWRTVLSFEAHRLQVYERYMLSRAARAIAVSEADARCLGEDVEVIPNGVDIKEFYPAAPDAQQEGLIFTGNLSYPPNIEAAEILVHEVMPLVRTVYPRARLRLVGAQPSSRVMALAGDGVEITGYVASVAEEIRASAVVVAPVVRGGGVKNKILEGMACGVPVIATPKANEGIDAIPDKEILLAERPNEMAAQAIELLCDSERALQLGRAGRELAVNRFSWQHAGETLLGIYRKLDQTRQQ